MQSPNDEIEQGNWDAQIEHLPYQSITNMSSNIDTTLETVSRLT